MASVSEWLARQVALLSAVVSINWSTELGNLEEFGWFGAITLSDVFNISSNLTGSFDVELHFLGGDSNSTSKHTHLLPLETNAPPRGFVVDQLVG